MGRWSCFRPNVTESLPSPTLARIDEPCRLLALPEPLLQLILNSLPGNEALAAGASCRALHEAVQRMQGMHARTTLLASRGRISFSTGSNTRTPVKACRARSFHRFLERGGSDMLASLTIRIRPAAETLFSEFIGTQLYYPVPTSMWDPLAGLKSLTITVDDGNIGDTFSDIVTGCSGLTSLCVTLPGHWDTKYLFRQSGIAGLKHLRDLTIETQRLSFYNAFTPPPAPGDNAADPPPLPRLRLLLQELAMYGGAVPVSSGVRSMEVVVSNQLHYADYQALQRLLDGADAGLTLRLDQGALRPFAKRQNVSVSALAEEQMLAENVLAMCRPAHEHAPAIAA